MSRVKALLQNKSLLIQLAVFIFLFLCFSLSRFYNLDKRVTFDWDQENIATNVWNIVKDHHFTLLGPRATSDTGFFLGPQFTYVMVPFFLLTHLHPSAMTIFLIFYNIVFFVVATVVLYRVIGFQKTVLFLILWIANPLLQNYDSLFWWPVVIPLGTIFLWFILLKIYQKATILWSIILGTTLGFLMNMHFQAIFLLFFSGVFLAYLLWEKKLKIKHVISIILTFLIQFTPLFLFDLRNKFLNWNLFIHFYGRNVGDEKAYPTVWIPVFNNFIKNFLPIQNDYWTMIAYAIIVLLTFILFKKKNNFFKVFYLSTTLLLLCVAGMFTVYGKRPSEYYFVFLYPFLYIIFIDIFLQFRQKYFMAILTLLFVIFNFSGLINNTAPNMFGLHYKDQTVLELKKIEGHKSFNATFDGSPNADTGFRYLFQYYSLNETDNPKDPHISVSIPAKENQKKIGGIGMTFNH